MKWLIPLLLLTACSNIPDQCEAPVEYLDQSNCRFGVALVEGQCAVVCPIHGSEQLECSEDNDCNCLERGDRTIECRCLDGTCYSVEEWMETK